MWIIRILFVLTIAAFVCADNDVSGSIKFTTDFYRHAFDANENSVYSPISFRILLSLCYQSASGSTATQLQEYAYFSSKQDEAITQAKSVETLETGGKMKIVNRLYVSQGATLKQQFVQSIAKYRSSAEHLNFGKAEESARKINEYVEEQTNGLIKNLITPSSITPDVALFLINTVYFKAKWLVPFSADQMRSQPFHAIDGNTYDITFMGDDSQFKTTTKSINSRVVELPYEAGTNYKFWMILPNENSNIQEVKDKLNADTIQEISNRMTKSRLLLRLPSFEVESEVDGVGLLKKLGITDLFEKSELDMINGALLKVDEAKQKAKIIVNNEGTEASAATYLRASAYSRPPVVYFDRPFIFLLLQETTNEIVFIGHFSKPN